MARCQVLVVLNIPQCPSVILPASSALLSECYEYTKDETGASYLAFPSAKKPQALIACNQIACMVMQEEKPDITIPNGAPNMRIR